MNRINICEVMNEAKTLKKDAMESVSYYRGQVVAYELVIKRLQDKHAVNMSDLFFVDKKFIDTEDVNLVNGLFSGLDDMAHLISRFIYDGEEEKG